MRSWRWVGEMFSRLVLHARVDNLQVSSSSRHISFQIDLVFLHCNYWSCTHLRPRKCFASLFKSCSRVHWHIFCSKSIRPRQFSTILGITLPAHLRKFPASEVSFKTNHWRISVRLSFLARLP